MYTYYIYIYIYILQVDFKCREMEWHAVQCDDVPFRVMPSDVMYNIGT